MSRIDLNNYEAYLLDYFEGNLSNELTAELKTFVLSHPELDVDLNDTELPVFSEDNVTFEGKNSLLKSESDLPDEEIIRYVEGLMTLGERTEFELKLSLNSQLAKETAAYKKTILPVNTSEVFADANSLLKTEEEFILGNRVIAYVEKQLPLKERIELQAELLTNENLRKELQLVQKTKLVANHLVTYPNKEELKKGGKVVVLFPYRNVVAIAAALILIFGLAILFTNLNTENNESKGIAGKTDSVITSPSNKKNNPLIQEEIIPQQAPQNLVAKNSNAGNVSTNSQSTAVNLNEDKNQVANNERNNIEQKQPQEPFINNTTVDTTVKYVANSIENSPANNSSTKTENKIVTRYTDVNMLAQTNDDDENLEKPAKKSFWKRAVNVAKQANGLGLKAIKGDEKSDNNYLLSFNSLSIEKK